MIDPRADDILISMHDGKLTVVQAVEALRVLPCHRDDATEVVFLSLGGSDLVEIGEDGVRRYQPSGKTVASIERAMKGAKETRQRS